MQHKGLLIPQHSSLPSHLFPFECTDLQRATSLNEKQTVCRPLSLGLNGEREPRRQGPFPLFLVAEPHPQNPDTVTWEMKEKSKRLIKFHWNPNTTLIPDNGWTAGPIPATNTKTQRNWMGQMFCSYLDGECFYGNSYSLCTVLEQVLLG